MSETKQADYAALVKNLERQGERRYPREEYEFDAARAIRTLTTQRDMLVKALEAALPFLEATPVWQSSKVDPVIEQCRAALSQTKQGAQS